MLNIHFMVFRSPSIICFNRLFLETSNEQIRSPQITANAQKYCPSLHEASKRIQNDKQGECRRGPLICVCEGENTTNPRRLCEVKWGRPLHPPGFGSVRTHTSRECVITALRKAASLFPLQVTPAWFFFCTVETMSDSPSIKHHEC